MTGKGDDDDRYNEEEVARRWDATTRAMIRMRPKPQKSSAQEPRSAKRTRKENRPATLTRKKAADTARPSAGNV
jgi:hypothetical protein